MTVRSNSDLLDLVYEAALDPTVWTPVMERFADMIGGESGWLSRLSTEDDSGADESDPLARVDPVWTQRYLNHFGQCNPLHHVENSREYMRRWRPRILTDEDWMAKDALVRTEYYNDFMRPQGIGSCLMIRLAARGVEIATMNFSRTERRGQFSGADLELADRIHPHLIRAFDMGQRFASTRRLAGELASVLDRSQHGLFVLSDDGLVRHVNRAGERLVGEESGLRLVDRRLTAANSADARQLAALIGAAGTPERERRTGGSMALSTPNRRAPLSITIAPVRSDQLAPVYRGHSILVCVTDLEANVTLPEQKLRGLFGLTPAEARLALAIFEGLSPTEAAASFGVSPNTVRVQLGHIFEKTGTNRQSELVRLMMRAVGVETDERP
jgi:DNA-binding CsgD family transcriptional regulator/PAS domain-containing protein